MTTLRTKQQTACDGIRTTWYADTFTEILHQQVAAKFSIDGVVPTQAMNIQRYKKWTTPPVVAITSRNIFQKQEKVGKFVGAMDGVRLPWKQTFTTA